MRDRLASAFGSAVMMAITFILLAIVTAVFAILSSFFHMLDGHGVKQLDDTARLVLFLDGFLIAAFCGFMAVAALMGFVLGSERMARLFGILWQTETPTRGEFWIATFMAAALLGTMLIYALRKLAII